MRWALLLVIALVVPVALADDVEPNAVLQAAEAAMANLKTVTYEASGTVEGPAAAELRAAEGRVSFARSPAGQPARFRADVRVKRADGADRVEMAVSGRKLTTVDHAAKLFSERELSRRPSLALIATVFLPELVQDKPFATGYEKLEYVGREKVGEVDCDVIKIHPAGTRWAFGVADHLPRRVEKTFQAGNAQSIVRTTVTKLDPNPELNEGTFQLERPEGFASLGSDGLIAAGGPAPDWTLKDADGKEISLKSLRGKVVVLDFWATWCGPCRMAMPHMQELWNRHKGQAFALFGVNCREKPSGPDPLKFIRGAGFTYPVLLRGDSVASAYQVSGIPAFYVIGADGRVLMSAAGVSPEITSRMTATVAQAVASTSQPATAPAPAP
jgi:thiol-disulfide isomerase/thioredoxin